MEFHCLCLVILPTLILQVEGDSGYDEVQVADVSGYNEVQVDYVSGHDEVQIEGVSICDEQTEFDCEVRPVII